MIVRVLFFASLADRLGVREVALDVADDATVADALDAAAGRYPDLAAMRQRLATAVNMTYVGAGHPLKAGDELALIPPVSGG